MHIAPFVVSGRAPLLAALALCLVASGCASAGGAVARSDPNER